MKVLGERPYPLKESIREYLEELEKRKVEEEKTKEMEAAEAAMNATSEDAAQEEEGTKSGGGGVPRRLRDRVQGLWLMVHGLGFIWFLVRVRTGGC